MVGPEGEHSQDLSQEIGTKPKWISIQEMVLPGTIGLDLVASVEGLGKRQRPATTFNQPIASLWINPKSVARKELEEDGIKTVAEILALSSDKFSLLTRQSKIKERLKSYLEDLTLTPHARLLHAIFGKRQYPIPPDRELEFVNSKKVEEVFKTLTAREFEVIKLRFGIETGVTMTLKEISAIRGVTSSAINMVENRTLRKLCHPTRSRRLIDYLSVPPQSFGRKIFNAILSKDLPEIQAELEERGWFEQATSEIQSLKLSQSTEQELRDFLKNLLNDSFNRPTLRDFLMFDPGGALANLSDQAFGEIKEKFERLARETQEKQKATEEQASHPVDVFVAPKLEEEPAVNNFFA